MSGPLPDAEVPEETPTAVDLAPAPRPLAASLQNMPIGQPAAANALDRIQVLGSRALAETLYQARRLGVATLAGIASVVVAATLFIANNLPQGAAVAALKSQLAQLAPAAKGAAMAPLSGSVLASLPPRGEAPGIVAKILEEARASGVELPRGPRPSQSESRRGSRRPPRREHAA